jgi:hypothetical protein
MYVRAEGQWTISSGLRRRSSFGTQITEGGGGGELPGGQRIGQGLALDAVGMCGSSATKTSSSMRWAAAAAAIRDGSFARTASKMGSTEQACALLSQAGEPSG